MDKNNFSTVDAKNKQIELYSSSGTQPVALDSLNVPKITVPLPQPIEQLQSKPVDNTAQIDEFINATKAKEGEASKQSTNIYKAISDLQPTLLGEFQSRAEERQKSGVNQLSQEMSSIKGQIKIKEAEIQKSDVELMQSLQNIEDKPIAMEFITGQQASVQRNAKLARALKTSEIGVLNARAMALQGDYTNAIDAAEQAVELKYAPQRELINMYQSQLKALEPQLNKEEKEQAREQAIRTQLMMDNLKEAQASDKAKQSMIMNAISQGAPQSLIAQASKAGSSLQSAMILGQYSGDYYKTELLKNQIATEKAQRAKIYNDINAKNQAGATPFSVVGQNMTAPNGDSVGLPMNYLSAISNTKLNEGQANAVSFVARMIQAAKNIDGRTGDVTGSKMNFYETSKYDPTSAGSAVGRLVGSDNSRLYNADAEDFIRAQLRKESGASIAPDELAGAKTLYLAEGAGQDEKDLLLAKQKRDGAVKSMIAQAGPAAPILLKYYEETKATTSNDSSKTDAAIKQLEGAYGAGATPISAGYAGYQPKN
jgi:hypothetical protein